MEKTMAAVVGQLLPQQSSPPGTPLDSDTDLPELTQEEQDALILLARRNKRDMAARQAYYDAVRADAAPVTMTPSELSDNVRTRFKINYGREFILDDMNQQIFDDLCHYFTGSEGPLDPSKGIMMIGNIGVGKTETMKLFHFNPLASYGFINCRTIVDGFMNSDDDKGRMENLKSYSVIRKNAKPHPFNQDHSGICFDDLGTEEKTAMHYGNAKNVMAEIILNRYDNRLPFNFTHITTNLAKDDVIKHYGNRAWDRIQQMMNIIVFPGTESRR